MQFYKFFADPKNWLTCLVFHLALGLASSFNGWVCTAWVVIAGTAFGLLTVFGKNENGVAHCAAAYFCGLELLSRMAGAPIVPWEVGKYAGTIFLLAGVVFGGGGFRFGPGWVMLLCLLPAPFSVAGLEKPGEAIIFNWGGLLALVASVIYFYGRKISLLEVGVALRFLASPIVAIAALITVRNPNVVAVDYDLAANFDTTGSYGSNQVSVMLGLGALVCVSAIFLRKPLFKYQWIDVVLGLYFLFRGLLSFSRGGVASAVISVILMVALLFFFSSQFPKSLRLLSGRVGGIIVGVALLSGMLIVANAVTEGKLLQRFLGDTNSTLDGSREKDLAVITTGRYGIAITDLKMWFDHPVFGVGLGRSKELRHEYGGMGTTAAHTEYTRLLAEQGFFGLAFILCLVGAPLIVFFSKMPMATKLIMVGFCSFTLTTMLHTATRLFATSFVYGIGFALVMTAVLTHEKRRLLIRARMVQRLRELRGGELDSSGDSGNYTPGLH